MVSLVSNYIEACPQLMTYQFSFDCIGISSERIQRAFKDRVALKHSYLGSHLRESPAEGLRTHPPGVHSTAMPSVPPFSARQRKNHGQVFDADTYIQIGSSNRNRPMFVTATLNR